MNPGVYINYMLPSSLPERGKEAFTPKCFIILWNVNRWLQVLFTHKM